MCFGDWCRVGVVSELAGALKSATERASLREATLYREHGLPSGYSVAVPHGLLERHRMGHIGTGSGSGTVYTF